MMNGKERASIKPLDFGSTIPWDIVIPAAFFASSAACFYDPSLSPTICFFMIGCGMLCFDSVSSYFTKPVTKGLSKALTNSMMTFADEENRERTDMLLDALSVSIGRALESSSLKNTVKKSFIETMSDDELQSAVISTVKEAMEKAGQNDELKATAFDITKGAFVGALSDESFINESMEAAVDAMVTASQNAVLCDSLLSVVKQAISEAMHDEEFVAEFRTVVKDCLTDGDIYRAGAKGVVSAAFGGRKKSDSSNKEDSSHSETGDDSSNKNTGVISKGTGAISRSTGAISAAFGGKKKDDSSRTESSSEH